MIGILFCEVPLKEEGQGDAGEDLWFEDNIFIITTEWKVTGTKALLVGMLPEMDAVANNPRSLPASPFGFALRSDQFEWLLKNLLRDGGFRRKFLKILKVSVCESLCGVGGVASKWCVLVEDNFPGVIDKLGGMLANSLALTRCELETALSWLSTLGGAFSALGDLSTDYAEEAAKISLKQLKIAWKLDDPLIQSRCRIYMAISLIQRGRLKEAKETLKREYNYALSLPPELDPRLKRMCLGVWSKLQYYWLQRISSKSQAKG